MSTRSLAPTIGMIAALSFAAFGIYIFNEARKSGEDALKKYQREMAARGG